MRAVRAVAALLPILCLWPLAALGQEAPPEPVPPPPGFEGVLALDGLETPLAMAAGAAGPLFTLEPIAARLGVELAPGALGQSSTMTLGETALVFGPGTPALTLGREIVPLSQPAVAGPAGLLVPLDFLERTFGALLGVVFEWQPEGPRLLAARSGLRELPVVVDVVHLQGLTTVVLQLPEQPRYRVVQAQGEIQILLLGDRLRPPASRPRLDDPLVRAVEVTPERVRVALAPNATAEAYALRNPFRIVIDVLQAAAPSSAGASARRFAPLEGAAGIRTIVLDPGHGGEETGAIGRGGAAEKDLTLLLAQALKSRLESRLSVRVALTRNEDVALPLDTRTAIANQFKADLFVSIHLNSSFGNSARGAETYFLAEAASDERAASAAATENASPGAANGDSPVDLQLILWDLAQSHSLAESQRFASFVQEELNLALDLRDRGVKQAPFRVLRGAAMPAVLVELGFLSNPDEEARLQDPAYRAELVDALVDAIARYKTTVEAGPPAEAAPPGGGVVP